MGNAIRMLIAVFFWIFASFTVSMEAPASEVDEEREIMRSQTFLLCCSISGNSSTYKDYCKSTLESAAQNNQMQLAECMLTALEKCSLFTKTISKKYIKDAFFIAVKKGNIPLVKRILVANKKIVNQEMAGKTALFMAADQNNLPLALVLLEAGANPNHRSKPFALYIDPQQNSNSHARGSHYMEESTPLFYAACVNDVPAIRLLFEIGANPDSLINPRKKRPFKRTALMQAIIHGNYEAVKALVHGIPYPMERSPYAKLSFLKNSYFHFLPHDLGIELNKYYRVHADPNVSNKSGMTPFACAILYREEKIKEFLKRNGALNLEKTLFRINDDGDWTWQ